MTPLDRQEEERLKAERDALRKVALGAARKATRNEPVAQEAADEAIRAFYECDDAVGNPEGWVTVAARNYAFRWGKKEAREPAFGAMGSAPPPQFDELLDRHVERLISDMHRGGMSLGSLVANQVTFDERWGLLSQEARDLLEAKYVEGWPAKELAERLGITPGTVDNKLWKARLAAREVLLDVIDDLRG